MSDIAISQQSVPKQVHQRLAELASFHHLVRQGRAQQVHTGTTA